MNDGQYISADTPVKPADLEDQLASTLLKTSEEVSRIECFDDEQRAEVYTILQTMRTETQQHRHIVGRWTSLGASHA